MYLGTWKPKSLCIWLQMLINGRNDRSNIKYQLNAYQGPGSLSSVFWLFVCFLLLFYFYSHTNFSLRQTYFVFIYLSISYPGRSLPTFFLPSPSPPIPPSPLNYLFFLGPIILTGKKIWVKGQRETKELGCVRQGRHNAGPRQAAPVLPPLCVLGDGDNQSLPFPLLRDTSLLKQSSKSWNLRNWKETFTAVNRGHGPFDHHQGDLSKTLESVSMVAELQASINLPSWYSSSTAQRPSANTRLSGTHCHHGDI